jgi:hypothetical protein
VNTARAKIFVTLGCLAGLAPGGFALGSVKPSSSAAPGPRAAQASAPRAARATTGHKKRDPSSFYRQLQADVFARLRPVEREEPIDFDEATALLRRKTTNEKIFDKEFVGRMKGEYNGRVRPFEETANDPVWRPRYWEMERYENGRHDLAQWTTREVVEDELKDFFNGADKDSAAVKVLSTARELSGGGDDKPAEPKLTKEQKLARAHRTDLPKAAAPAEEKIPTRLKTKLNLLRQNGSLVFTNPVAITSLSGNRDEISLNMDRDFRQLSLHSNVAYGVKQECLNVNVSKKITDEVSLNLDHVNYTGDKRGAAGEKSREQARVNYSISF